MSVVFNHTNTFEKKIGLTEKQKEVDAKRNEQSMQAYYHQIEKQAPKDNVQAKHKPYQCDIELK